MYRVILTNNGIEKIISDECDVSGINRIKGTCKIGINTINSFTFDIYSTNPCYNDLYSLITFIDIFNTKTNEYEFRGRILIISENMDSSGRLYKKAICESDLGFFLDSTQDYEEYQNITVKEFLEIMINRHNSKVEIEKHFKIGNVNVLDSTYKSLDYDKTYNLIKNKLIDVLGGEFQVRYVDNIRYLDYLTQIGSVKNTTIELAKNLQTIEKEQDSSNVVTKLTPLGNKLEGTEKRLTVESVNKGIEYIEDKEAIKKFGIINRFEIWDDVTTSENLLKKGELFLKSNNKIQKKYKIDALDLKLIDLDLDSFKVGNSYPIINDLMNLNEVLRIVEKTINIESPEKSTLIFGDKFDDIKQYQLNLIDTSKMFNKKAGEINNVLSGLNSTVNNATSDIIELNTKIENIPKNYLTTNNILNVLTSNSTSDAASANTVKYLNDSKFEIAEAKKLMCKTLSSVNLNNYKDRRSLFFYNKLYKCTM